MPTTETLSSKQLSLFFSQFGYLYGCINLRPDQRNQFLLFRSLRCGCSYSDLCRGSNNWIFLWCNYDRWLSFNLSLLDLNRIFNLLYWCYFSCLSCYRKLKNGVMITFLDSRLLCFFGRHLTNFKINKLAN